MNKYLIVIACMMLLYSCSEENNHVPVTDDPTIPGQVTKVHPESLPGAIKLTYELPDGHNLSYVKAECMINGVLRQVKASSYVNTLTIEGFADTQVRTVYIYSVNRSEKASEPVLIDVKPLTPNFLEVFKTIDLIDDWGGACVFFKNPYEADLAISLIHVDSTGFWNQGETFYTKRKEGSFSVRGFKPKETKFGVYIRDRWNNVTDTLVKNLVPRFEKQFDRKNFRTATLPSDVPDAWGWVLTNLWDGNVTTGFHTAAESGWPQWFTFDLGVGEGALLSRFKLWQRRDGATKHQFSFTDRNVKKFEIWGSMNPNPNGALDNSWSLLLDGELIKPSGLPLGQLSDEDREAMDIGQEFIFPLDIPYVRFIRMLVKETWLGAFEFYLMELAFWGSEPSDNPEDDE